MVQNVSNHFNRFGLDNDDANTFMALFSSDAAEKIRAHLSEQLVRDGKRPVQTIAELYEVIATGKLILLSKRGYRKHASTPPTSKSFSAAPRNKNPGNW